MCGVIFRLAQNHRELENGQTLEGFTEQTKREIIIFPKVFIVSVDETGQFSAPLACLVQAKIMSI